MNKIKTYGFSLIEIMAALAILSIGMSSIMAVFPAGMESFRKARDNTVLANLMRSKVSELTYELGSPIGRGDNASRIAKYYLKADTAFARYMSDQDRRERRQGRLLPNRDERLRPFPDPGGAGSSGSLKSQGRPGQQTDPASDLPST